MAFNNRFSTSVERGTFVYGIIGSILSGVGILTGIGLILYIILNFYINDKYSGSDAVLLCLQLTALVAPCLIFFIFANILVYGVCKKKPVLVLTFFIFGLVTLPLFALTNLFGYYTIGFIAYGLYLLFMLPMLTFVWKTYRYLKKNHKERLAFQNYNNVLYQQYY